MRYILVLCLFCAYAFATPALAAQNAVRSPAAAESNDAAERDSAKAAAARAVIKASATPIAVEHEGTDSLGARLAYIIKEQFNSGTLFSLDDKDVPKLQMLIVTQPEFPSRPGVGSVYSVIWVYSERSSVLGNYLAQESGIITAENLTDISDNLTARTAGIAAKHAYIFNK